MNVVRAASCGSFQLHTYMYLQGLTYPPQHFLRWMARQQPDWAGPFWNMIVLLLQPVLLVYSWLERIHHRMRPRGHGRSPGDMPASLKKKMEDAATVGCREGPSLPSSMRHRALPASGVEFMNAAAAHASGARAKGSLTDAVPAVRDELYDRYLDYEKMARGRVIQEKIAPWVEKQVIENFGESVPRLVNMVCSKIVQRQPAQAIEAELMRVLDEDGITLTVRLWTLLHYEINQVQ